MNKPPGVGIDLSVLLYAARRAETAVESGLNAIGLSVAKLAALKTLADAGESLPLSQLAERLSCVKSNITQLVDRLEADGLVSRESDPGDRRTKLAVLTAAGRKACREGRRVQEDAERRVLGRLSASESEQLAALLSKLRA
ncbi:MAG TPA: MarR family transcriptional regulator [Vicinamibacterales bacterium]|nr:MarR family transcriptional regulator [Vicinamibacterales bacterium]